MNKDEKDRLKDMIDQVEEANYQLGLWPRNREAKDHNFLLNQLAEIRFEIRYFIKSL